MRLHVLMIHVLTIALSNGDRIEHWRLCSGLTLQQGAEHGAQERFQSFMTMMDSMTDKELDHPDIQKLLSDTQQVRKLHGHDGSKFPPWAAKGAPSIGRSRIKRIAVGCGQAEPMVSGGWLLTVLLCDQGPYAYMR